MDRARANLWQLDNEPGVQTALHWTIGSVYTSLDSFRSVEQELRHALDMARRYGSEEDVAWVQLALGDLEIRTEKDPRIAETDYRQALRYVRQAGVHADPDLAHNTADSVAGGLWTAHGHSPEVEALLHEAVGIARANPSLRGFALAGDLSNLAAYLGEEGKNDEAEKLLEEALAIERSMPRPTMVIGTTLEALAQARSRRGDLAGAERYFRACRDEMLKQVGPNHEATIDAVARWGRLWALLGHADEAVVEVGEAVEAARKIQDNQRLWVVLVSYAYVLNLANQGKEAEAYARESLVSVKHVDRKDPRRAESLCETGVSLVLQKRFREAVPLLDESQRIYIDLPGWGPKHRQTLRVQEYLAKAHARAD